MTERRPGNYDRELHRKAQERAELKRKEEAYLREQEERRELREIEAKRAEVAEHLTRRAVDYFDRTGSNPPASLVEQWTADFVNGKQQQAETQRRQGFTPVY